MDQEKLKDDILSTIFALGFFSRVFRQEPKGEFLAFLAEERMFSIWPVMTENADTISGLCLLQDFFSTWQDENLAKVKRDFQQLFIGPEIKAVPFESAWRSPDRLLFDTQTLEVRSFYRKFGLQAPDLNRKPDDHLGLEFAFMLHLFTRAFSLMDRKNGKENLKEIFQAQKAFFSNHVITWIPDCLRKVVEHARTDYYRGAAMLGLGCLERTGEFLKKEITIHGY